MPVSLEGKLVVALSSRALFDFEEENRVFEDSDDSPIWRYSWTGWTNRLVPARPSRW
jgi:hypothetical protein